MNVRTGLIAGAGAAAGAVLMLALGWGLQHAAMTTPQVLGRPAPPLTIETLDGSQLAVGKLEGAPVVLNFWASWCGPCAQELPVLSAASTDHPNVKFLGAAIRDTTGGVESFEERHQHPYPVGLIVDGSYQSYGVVAPPSTMFIDAQGVVVASFSGPLDGQALNHYLGLIS